MNWDFFLLMFFSCPFFKDLFFLAGNISSWLIISFLFQVKYYHRTEWRHLCHRENSLSLSPRAEAEEDGEEVISPDGQYLMHMAAQSWLLLGGATKLNITQKRFLSARSPGLPAPAACCPFSPAQPGRRPRRGRQDFHLRCEPSCTIYKPNLGLKLYYQRQGVAK